ncbi:MAG: alkene reductase [Gammaproteobacteria bacterium]|nr:alkene reductase [Gammaproteobacteria bacterium]
MPTLFDPVRLGDLSLRNRIVMAPMTRSRAGEGDAPTAMNVEYYRQRASAGLIVTEGTQPSANGKGYCRTPGLHTSQQVRAWRAVTDAVHHEGGCIVVQLMHCGRIASHYNKDPGTETVAPSAIRAAGKMYTDAAGMVDFDMPRALALEEIPGVIDEYRQATRLALEAGFDGVELHCGSGYLPEQFLTSGANHRTDAYGGSAANRARFVVETLAAMSEVAGSGRVGLRLRAGNDFNDTHDDDPVETYGTLLEAVNPLGLAYLHLIRMKTPRIHGLELARAHFRGPILLNDGLTPESAQRYLDQGAAAAVSFARHFIGNPDLVRRLREGLPLAEFDRATLYTPGPKGYIDYLTLG